MTTLTQSLAPNVDALKADRLYEALRPTLEPEHNGEFIVIHPGTGEYLIGKDGAALMLTLHQKYKDGTLQRRRIGPPTESDRRFVARLQVEQQLHDLRAK